MRLEQISYFLQVAETQSMTGAAKELYISQPALSKQIALLEREVGVPLFERKARGVVLTSAGRQFEKDLKNILKELENAKKNAALAGKARKQLLNVGCFDGVYTDDFLPQLFEYFQRNAPELKLVLHRMSFSEGTKALKGNKIDLWLTLQLGWEGAGNFCEMQLIRRKAALIFPSESRWGRQEQLSFDDFPGRYLRDGRQGAGTGRLLFLPQKDPGTGDRAGGGGGGRQYFHRAQLCEAEEWLYGPVGAGGGCVRRPGEISAAGAAGG